MSISKLWADAEAALHESGPLAAFEILREAVASERASLDEAYFAGECALQARLWIEAAQSYEIALNISAREANDWYVESALLGKAFACLELGRYQDARECIASVDPEACVFWIKTLPAITRDLIETRIAEESPTERR